MPFAAAAIGGHLQAALAKKGVRLTRQRRAILAVIEGADRHLDAAQILRWARRLEPSVDRVTVYRTLAMLKKRGLVDELDLMHVSGEKHYYEQHTEHEHVHVTCLRCGHVIELESELLNELRARVERECGFRMEVTRIEMGGYCNACARGEKPSADAENTLDSESSLDAERQEEARPSPEQGKGSKNVEA